MRLKKLMSLVLACAMLMSLATVASAADTEVYYVEDFSAYEDIQAYFSTQSAPAGAPGSNPTGGDSLGYVFNATKADGATNRWHWSSSNAGGIGDTRSELSTNTLGHTTFKSYTDEYQAANAGNYTWYHIADNAWDFVENSDETYVISFELEANPKNNAATTNYTAVASAWASAPTTAEGVTTWSTAPYLVYAYGSTSYADTTTFAYNSILGKSHVTDMKGQQLDSSKTYRMALAYKYNPSNNATGTNGIYYWPTRLFAVDGGYWMNAASSVSNVKWEGSNVEGGSKLYGAYFSNSINLNQEFANIKMYTIKSDDFKVTTDVVKDVPLSTKTVRVKFSNIVSPVTYAAPTVYENGTDITANVSIGNITDVIGNVGGEIYSYVDITFDTLLEASTYEIVFPETVSNEIATTLGANNKVTFETKMPDVKVTNFTVVSAAGSLVADGSVQGAKVALENTTTASKNVAVIYAVYASNGQLSNVVYANDAIEGGKTLEVEAGIKLTEAGTLKAFVWDTMSALKPYTGAQTVAIAAAAQ